MSLNPASVPLTQLTAHFEPNVNPFDQWDVELGEVLARRIVLELTADHDSRLGHDSSTSALVRRYRKMRAA
jgi:glucose-6-phosphate isomerase